MRPANAMKIRVMLLSRFYFWLGLMAFLPEILCSRISLLFPAETVGRNWFYETFKTYRMARHSMIDKAVRLKDIASQ